MTAETPLGETDFAAASLLPRTAVTGPLIFTSCHILLNGTADRNVLTVSCISKVVIYCSQIGAPAVAVVAVSQLESLLRSHPMKRATVFWWQMSRWEAKKKKTCRKISSHWKLHWHQHVYLKIFPGCRAKRESESVWHWKHYDSWLQEKSGSEYDIFTVLVVRYTPHVLTEPQSKLVSCF